MMKKIANFFRTLFGAEKPLKSPAETLEEARGKIALGWSHDTPTKQDAKGNTTHFCAEAAMVSVHDGHPGAWKFINAVINPVSTMANSMTGINVLGELNCRPDMTKTKMLGIFDEAVAKARRAEAV